VKRSFRVSIASGAFSLALCAVPVVQAQDGAPPPPPPGGHMPMGGGMGFPGGAMGGHMGPGLKVVVGLPYSADVSSQSVQSFADGNTISRSTTGRVARDSQGRTYTQETINGGFVGANGPMVVTFITDPVAGYDYVLNATKKTATRIQRHTPGQNGGQPGDGPGPGMRGRRRGEGDAMGGPGGSGDRPNVQTNDLGTQTIAGVPAKGKSVSHTIPAGAIGNSQPIVSSGETWTSPDLQVIVLAKRNDPRMGQSTYALQNIQRAEPPASLFQVPSDYTVQDAKGGPFGFGGGQGRGNRPPQ
jgi:hypothetical protein